MSNSGLLEVLRRAQALGFIGPGSVEDHATHAESFSVVDPPARALDLGSGGGLPGLVLAVRWPASRWLLLDAQQRRGGFLEGVIGELGLGDRVTVLVERAERAAHGDLRSGFDLVVARSFGPAAVTAECGAGFLRVGGALVVSEPPDEQNRWSASGLAELGLGDEGRQGGVRVLRSLTALDRRFPRRVGVPSKRPLW